MTWIAERRSATSPFLLRTGSDGGRYQASRSMTTRGSWSAGAGSHPTSRMLRLSGDDSVRAARRDPLTGLANRLLVRELLEEAVLRQWEGQSGCALLLVDLDRFKLVNDTLGHAIGDQLLVEVAHRLETTVGEGGRVGRIGGDEFAIVWGAGCDRDGLAAVADRMIADLSKSFTIGAATLHVGATIGIARRPGRRPLEEQLMRSADLGALPRQGSRPRRPCLFRAIHVRSRPRITDCWKMTCARRLSGDGLTLAYQPIVDAGSGEVVGREALLRWRHPKRGDIPPDQFIPIIEDAGLIHQIGDWVIREACAEARQWDGKLTVAVNISAAQLSGAGLAKTVLGALAATRTRAEPARAGSDRKRLPGRRCGDAGLARTAARARRADWCSTTSARAIRSFGYLSRAHFSKIKIDQSFVRGAAEGARRTVSRSSMRSSRWRAAWASKRPPRGWRPKARPM